MVAFWTVMLQRQIGHVLRTALVKPAMNSAANTHASTRNTQPTADSTVQELVSN